MARKRVEERRMQEMVELGRKNAQLYPKVKNWCKHLEIKMESYGLLAEAGRILSSLSPEGHLYTHFILTTRLPYVFIAGHAE